MTGDIFRGAPPGEIAVVGLGRSGRAAARLLLRAGYAVYASDAGSSAEVAESASALVALGAAAETGGHDLDRIGRTALVVASPGVPPDSPPLRAATEARVPVVSEIEVALHGLSDPRVIAVTGTNGKTTTTALVGHLLRALGHDAVDAGNIGLPLSELALRDVPPTWIALELSSFQLHDTPSIRPLVGVLTNLSPDHLDRYTRVEDYYADKARLFSNATPESTWVLNGDDAAILAMVQSVAGARYHFSLTALDADGAYDRASDALVVLGEPLLPRREFPLLGDHNVANALAAALAVMVADPAHQSADSRLTISAALRRFRPLVHRLEVVCESGGVRWINDSKATNVSSTVVALEGMTQPYILLLGGRHKGEPYTALVAPFRKFGKRVLAYGEAASTIERDLADFVPVERLGTSFETVMNRARELAVPGDAVLLSPACSSYDMFKNYEERGAVFRRLAAAGEIGA